MRYFVALSFFAIGCHGLGQSTQASTRPAPQHSLSNVSVTIAGVHYDLRSTGGAGFTSGATGCNPRTLQGAGPASTPMAITRR